MNDIIIPTHLKYLESTMVRLLTYTLEELSQEEKSTPLTIRRVLLDLDNLLSAIETIPTVIFGPDMIELLWSLSNLKTHVVCLKNTFGYNNEQMYIRFTNVKESKSSYVFNPGRHSYYAGAQILIDNQMLPKFHNNLMSSNLSANAMIEKQAKCVHCVLAIHHNVYNLDYYTFTRMNLMAEIINDSTCFMIQPRLYSIYTVNLMTIKNVDIEKRSLFWKFFKLKFRTSDKNTIEKLKEYFININMIYSIISYIPGYHQINE